MKALARAVAHSIFRVRNFNNKEIKKFAKNIQNKKILELGSGKKRRNKQHYSAARFFDSSNDITLSDINEEFGHEVIDVTKMQFNEEFDIILCMNVLEHVFDFHKAIENLHKAVKKDGVVIIFVPGMYPLHDEPHDYWRFTEHALKRLLKNFSTVKIKNSGVRQYPFAYFVEAHK